MREKAAQLNDSCLEVSEYAPLIRAKTWMES